MKISINGYFKLCHWYDDAMSTLDCIGKIRIKIKKRKKEKKVDFCARRENGVVSFTSSLHTHN